MSTIKTVIAVALLVLASGTASAQRSRHYAHVRHYGRAYCYGWPYRSTVVVRPAVTTKVVNRLSQKERLVMAVSYLKQNSTIDAKEYAKITGLNRSVAEAELASFAEDKGTPIVLMNAKKKLYTLK